MFSRAHRTTVGILTVVLGYFTFGASNINEVMIIQIEDTRIV